MDGTAKAVADHQRQSQTRKRQANCQVKTEFVNTEPPLGYISEPDLFPDAIGRWFRFAISDRDNAERNQYQPDPDHQDGVVTPVKWDRYSQKVEINRRRNV